MAIDRTLADVDQEAFDAAEALILELMRADTPELDLRRGTALRDLVIRPAAQFHALNTLRITDLQKTGSLKLLLENPELGDIDTVDGLLTNLLYSRKPGEFARGVVQFNVSVEKDYSIPSAYELKDSSEFIYLTEQAFTARKDGVTDPTKELELFPNDDEPGTFFFLLPMVGEIESDQYQASESDVLTVVGRPLSGVDSVIVYEAFTDGESQESAQEALNNLPGSLSYRAFESELAINTRLRNSFTNVFATSSLGYGSEAQLRDKHNVMGVAVGNKVDIYVRSFRAPAVLALEKVGTKVEDGTYTISILVTDAPGYSVIKGITLTGNTFDGAITFELPITGSLPFTDVRAATGLTETFHEFDLDDPVIETAFTIFQTSTITVTNVPAVIIDGAATYPDTLDFKVDVYVPPNLLDIQNFIDFETVRNLEADQVVRGAIPCFVSFSASLYHDPGVVLDLDLIAQLLTNFVNERTFGEQLTASELTAIIHQFEVKRVNLDDTSDAGLKLEGTLRDAAGNIITLSGNVLDLDTVINPATLVTKDTTVFVMDRSNVFLKAIEV